MKIIVILFALMIKGVCAFSQGFTLDMAVDSALANNMDLKHISYQRDDAALQKKGAVYLSNTDIGLQRGQINTLLNDTYVEVDQNFGNPIQMLGQSKELGHLVSYHDAEFVKTTIRVAYEARIAWTNWVFLLQKKQMLEDQLKLIETYVDKLKRKQEVGEVSQVDLSLAEITRSELLTQISSLTKDIYMAENQLMEVCHIHEGVIAPTNVELGIDTSSLVSGGKSVNTELLQSENERIKMLNQSVKNSRSAYLPELSVGYFNQSIEHLRGYQGFKVGVSVPLLNKTHLNEIKRTNLEIAFQEEHLHHMEFALNNSYLAANNALQAYMDLYSNSDKLWTDQIRLLDEASKKELEAGMIDFYRYLQSQGKILDIRLNRLETIRQINLLSYEVSYYTTPVNQ